MSSHERFGYEWDTYDQILPIHEEQFKRWTCLFDRTDWAGKHFLDVGCGMGRNSYWPLSYGAKSGHLIDLDDRSISKARENLRKYSNVTIEKCSAYDLSIRNSFDIAFCIGVLHHLKYPELALTKMYDSCIDGGSCLIWVYGYENNEWIVNYINPIRKYITSKINIRILHVLSVVPAFLLWAGLSMFSPKRPYLTLLKNMSFPHLHSIVFDQLLPEVANYWRREEVLTLMSDAGFRDLRISPVNDLSWCCVGIK